MTSLHVHTFQGDVPACKWYEDTVEPILQFKWKGDGVGETSYVLKPAVCVHHAAPYIVLQRVQLFCLKV